MERKKYCSVYLGEIAACRKIESSFLLLLPFLSVTLIKSLLSIQLSKRINALGMHGSLKLSTKRSSEDVEQTKIMGRGVGKRKKADILLSLQETLNRLESSILSN